MFVTSQFLLFFLWETKIMQLSLRFEKIMHQRRLQPEYEKMSNEDLLSSIMSSYNDFKANAAIKRWQLSNDQYQAMTTIICSMCQGARDLIRQHLDFEKYEESGTSPLFQNISGVFVVIPCI